MTNTLLTPTKVTREALRVLHQKLNFVGSITRDYDDSFAQSGAKVGDTVKVRLPNQFVIRRGKTLTAQDTTETTTDLKITNQTGVDLNFTSQDLTLNLDDFSKRILEPAMATLAANIEGDALVMYKDVANSIWNGGAAATYNQFIDARVMLQRFLTPAGDRTALLNSTDMGDLVKDTKTLFADQKSIAEQYREGVMGRAAGYEFAENTILGSFAKSAAAGYLVNGASQTGASLIVDTGTTAPVAGEVFTIAGVFQLHPETKQSTGVLQQFVVGSGATTTLWPISPAIVTDTTKGTANVTAMADNAAVTIAGTASATSGVSLAYQKGAFAFATADLLMPKGVDFSARENFDGISIRIVRQYDINNDAFPCRLDVLYGWKTLRAQLAARIHNH
jgi:hypothetical protein